MAIWDQNGTTFLDKHWCFFSYTLFPFDLRIYSTTNLTLRLSRWLAPTSIIGIYESFRRLLRTNPSGNFPSFYTNKHIPVYIPCIKDPTHNTNLLGLYSPFVHWCLHFLVFFACTRERKPMGNNLHSQRTAKYTEEWTEIKSCFGSVITFHIKIIVYIWWHLISVQYQSS